MKNLVYILLLLCLQSNAATWSISAAGSGTGSGTSTANSMSYATFRSTGYTSVAALDIVNFAKGDIFAGAIPHIDNVTFGNYGTGANPIISGFTTLSTWTLSSGNIYYATLDVPVLHGVTLDGTVKGMGRYPNTGYLTYTSHTNNTSITGTSIGTLPFNTVGAEVVIRKVRWIIDRQVVTAHSGNTITYNALATYGNNNAYVPNDGWGYFIQAHLSTLDTEGEWYYDKVAKRLYMHFGSGTPTGRIVKASTVDVLNLSTYLNTFNNIDFEGGNNVTNVQGGGNITYNNCNFRQQGANAIHLNDNNNLSMTGGSISNCLNNSIFCENNVNNVTIDGVTITNSGLIVGAGSSGDGSHSGIYITGNGTTVKNCSLVNIGYTGIHFVGNNVLIEHNFVNYTALVKDDCAGIYTVISLPTVTGTNRVINANIVLNAVGNGEGTDDPSSRAAAGIYLDDFTNNVTVSNNYIAHGTSWGGIMFNGGHTITITNNTVFDFPMCLDFHIYPNSGTDYLGVAYTNRYVRNMIVTGNKFIARASDQYPLFVNQALNEAASLWGTINNNYYARPILETGTMAWYKWYYAGAPNTTTYYTVAGWNTASGHDANSLPSQVTTTNVSNIRSDYNFSASPVTVSVSGIYKEVNGTSYTNSISIPAYSGRVTIYTGAAPSSGGGKVYKSAAGKVLIYNGKIIVQ